jgi:AraC-like DNA-binding protein
MPASERFSFWWENVAQSVVSVDASSSHAADFSAELQGAVLGSVSVTRVRCAPFVARRTPRLIAQSDPGHYQLSLSLRGRSGLQQARREAALGPLDLTLFDSSKPFQAWTGSESCPDGFPSDGITVQFPRTMLPLKADQVSQLLAVPVSARQGIGALLVPMLTRLARNREQHTPADGTRLSSVVVDLIAAVLAQRLQEPLSSPEGDRRIMLVRVQAFIEANLGDSDLTPPTVASAHHVSTRHLHSLFRQEGSTVAGWIRSRRLDRCRRDLADPLLDALPVAAVCTRWGFRHPAHFSRLFRDAYGIPPAEFRRLMREPVQAQGDADLVLRCGSRGRGPDPWSPATEVP